MKKYNFLLKPVFFIFSLLFATWLVVEIEKVSPSDFGVSDSNVNTEPENSKTIYQRKQYLQNLCRAYKVGLIDSIKLDQKLINYLKTTESPSVKIQ